jgi:hypothetical protein
MTFLRGTWTVGPFKRIWLADIACMILVPVICEERKLGEEMEPLSRCPPNFRWALYWAQKLHNTTYISFINSSIWLLLGFVILSPVGWNLHSKWIVSLNFLQNVRLSFTDIFQFFLLKCSTPRPHGQEPTDLIVGQLRTLWSCICILQLSLAVLCILVMNRQFHNLVWRSTALLHFNLLSSTQLTTILLERLTICFFCQ